MPAHSGLGKQLVNEDVRGYKRITMLHVCRHVNKYTSCATSTAGITSQMNTLKIT